MGPIPYLTLCFLSNSVINPYKVFPEQALAAKGNQSNDNRYKYIKNLTKGIPTVRLTRLTRNNCGWAFPTSSFGIYSFVALLHQDKSIVQRRFNYVSRSSLLYKAKIDIGCSARQKKQAIAICKKNSRRFKIFFFFSYIFSMLSPLYNHFSYLVRNIPHTIYTLLDNIRQQVAHMQRHLLLLPVYSNSIYSKNEQQ